MLDIKLLREKPEIVKKSLALRGDPELLKKVDEVLEKDKAWRELKGKEDNLRSERNNISREVNEAKKQGKNIKNLIEKAQEILQKLQKSEEEEKRLKEEIEYLMLRIPNVFDKKVPKGKDASENKVIKKWGNVPKFKFKIKSHEELLENLGLLDMKRAAKLAGSGFYMFRNELARLERALISFFLDFHKKRGRTEIWSPILANPDTARGTAHLPKFDLDMYKTREGFYLIPTAEMTLTNIHRNEVLNEDELPKRFCGYTPCFRTEAGRHGSETPGIFRLHQFDKVEMVTLCKPEDNEKELTLILSDAEELLKQLEIPYRVIILCSGDSGFKESITYDIEVWSPYMSKYLECSSVSSCTDFQARRMDTFYLEKKSNTKKLVYTLNGSGLATPRLLISLVENNQQPDGSFKIPKCLWKYTGFKSIEPAKISKQKIKKAKKK
jgi:seryl-tRNA synthetase